MKTIILFFACIISNVHAIERFEDAESKRMAIVGFTLPRDVEQKVDKRSAREKIIHEKNLKSPRSARRRRGAGVGKKTAQRCNQGCSFFCAA